MRHEPALIDAVAREAAAEMVVDAALSDPRQRELDRLARVDEPVAKSGAPQERKELRLREFRRAANPAMDRIDRGHEAAGELGEPRFRRRLGARTAAWREPFFQRLGVVPDLDRLVAIDPRDFIQYTDECGTTEALLLGEVGAAPERLGAGGEEHGERPTALLAERMQRPHVDRIDVGALLAVDLDVDEEVVHHLRRRLVLEALMRHHVAPMAGGVADREQDWLAARARLGERRLAPGAPMDGIVLVLEEIRARLFRQLVTVRALLHGPSFRRSLG